MFVKNHETIELVIVDSLLPDGSGRDAINKFKKFESNIYIYIYIYHRNQFTCSTKDIFHFRKFYQVAKEIV